MRNYIAKELHERQKKQKEELDAARRRR